MITQPLSYTNEFKIDEKISLLSKSEKFHFDESINAIINGTGEHHSRSLETAKLVANLSIIAVSILGFP